MAASDSLGEIFRKNHLKKLTYRSIRVLTTIVKETLSLILPTQMLDCFVKISLQICYSRSLDFGAYTFLLLQMMFTFERASKHETERLVFISTKIALLVLIYTGASQVVCDQEISFCDTSFKELKNDVEVWNKKCWNNRDQGEGTPFCKAEKENNQERMKMHVEMCFYSG